MSGSGTSASGESSGPRTATGTTCESSPAAPMVGRSRPVARRAWPSSGTPGRAGAMPPLQHSAAVLGLSFSPDGKLLATAGRDWRVRLWDGSTGSPRGNPLTHLAPVDTMAFSPDGRLVLAGCRDGTAWLWDVASAGRGAAADPLGRGPGRRLRAGRPVRADVGSVEPRGCGNSASTSPRPGPSRTRAGPTPRPLAGRPSRRPGIEDQSVRVYDIESSRPLARPLPHPDGARAWSPPRRRDPGDRLRR